jgi:hypothetical protein
VAGYTSEHNERVNKLVLFAPIWIRKGAFPVSGIGAYRSVQKEAARQRKRQVVLGEGTHSVCVEQNRMQFIQQVQAFLDET